MDTFFEILGILYAVLFVVCIAYTWYETKKTPCQPDEEEKSDSKPKTE